MNKVTTALRKITGLIQRGRAKGKRIFVIRGGQGAGKTFALVEIICNSASSKEGREWIIISEELTKMRDTVMKDFVTILKNFNIYNEFRWNEKTLSYTFPNGSVVKFRSTDKEDAGKGARTYGVYFNEVNKVKFEAYNHYASRAELVLCDYNPDAPFFIDDEVIPREDCAFLQLTFADNEALSEVERDEIIGYLKKGYHDISIREGTKKGERYHQDNIKNPYWANKWRVYGLGDIGSLIGAIFNNWEVIPDIPEGARLRSGGLDFGYTNDPTAIIAVYEWNGCLVWDEVAYQNEMSNSKIAEKIKASALKFTTIYCDSAEPKSIADLRKLKVKAVAVDKGSDSIRFGIDKLQEKKILVTQRSTNTISNLRHYVWETDRNGKATNKPIDKHNHSIDAGRYEEVGKGKYNGKYTVR
jgi:phage terminase large subunit